MITPKYSIYDWDAQALLSAGIYLVESPKAVVEKGRTIWKHYIAQESNELGAAKLDFLNFLADWHTDALTDDMINDFIVELDWIIEDTPNAEPDYLEAQLMGYVHLIASRIAALRLNAQDCWIDSRDIFPTDENWKSAKLVIEVVNYNLETLGARAVISSAHVGVTPDNENTLIDDDFIVSSQV